MEQGNETFSSAVAETRKTGCRQTERLSKRECEVMDCVVKGLANKQIAAALNVSSNTVDTYLRRIYAKLHVQNRTAAGARFLSRVFVT